MGTPGSSDSPGRTVVVGAGLAGLGTVTALRKQGYAGELVLLGAEAHPPYDRPPLSKAVLLADEAPDPTLPFDPVEAGVDLRLGTRARALRDGVVETDTDDVAYDALVIATGAEPRRLAGTGARYLRTREDALALRAALRPGVHVLIVGAGWIGAEVATAARSWGARVTVLEQAATPVAHAVPAQVGAIMAQWYAEAGVDLVCGATVTAIEPDGVLFGDGQRLRADVVLVGVGVRPASDWLDGSPVDVDSGVLVGPELGASGTPGVWAVGDVTARWSPRYGVRIRGEHWDDALRAPAVVAANVLGAAQAYDPVPYVWSEQFGRMVQYAGHPPAGTRLAWRGDPAEGSWALFWLDDRGRILAVVAVDRPRDFVQARRLAEAGRPVDAVPLADPAIPVKAAAAA